MTILKEVLASNPIGVRKIETIEIVDSNLTGGKIAVCNNRDPITVTTENGTLECIPASVETAWPNKEVSGTQAITTRFSSVSFEYFKELKAVADGHRLSPETTYMYFRVYSSDDLTTPQETFRLLARQYAIVGDTISISSSYKNIVNKSALTLRYNATEHPGISDQ